MNTPLNVIPLIRAESGRPLRVSAITDIELASRLYQVGLFEGSEITKLDGEVTIRPVRVRGEFRDAVFGGGMTMKIIVHLDDGRRIPLAEMKPGEKGHIEGATCGGSLSGFLETLGFCPDSRITFLRSLPPMEYVTVTEKGERARLTEGMASKIWGMIKNETMQFVSSGAGEPFRVLRIFGGTRHLQNLSEMGIKPGCDIVLESVCQAQSLDMMTGRRSASAKPVIIAGREGLRLYLDHAASMEIMVCDAW